MVPSVDNKEVVTSDANACTSACLKSDEVEQITPNLDPELTQIIKAWHDLPDAIKAGIVAMVQTSTK